MDHNWSEDRGLVEIAKRGCEIAARKWKHNPDPGEALPSVLRKLTSRASRRKEDSASLKWYAEMKARAYFRQQYEKEKATRRAQQELSLEALRQPLVDPRAKSPLEILLVKECLETCYSLPEQDRRVLLARFQVEGSVPTLAKELGCKRQTIYQRCARILSRMGLALKDA